MKVLKERGMWGSNSHEDEREVRFFGLIQAKAENMGKAFFSWAGEGHELITEEFDGEDISGWLINLDEADEFEKRWTIDRSGLEPEFDDCMCVAEWSGEKNNPAISFRFW